MLQKKMVAYGQNPAGIMNHCVAGLKEKMKAVQKWLH
jgi:hypothetical protein